MGQFDWKSAVLVSFLRFRVIKEWISPHLVFSRNESDGNLEMAISCRRTRGKNSFDRRLKWLKLFLIGESDCRATNPLPRPPFPQTHPIKIFRHPFCSMQLKGLEIISLRITAPHTPLATRVISYALRHIRNIERAVV